MATDAPNDAPLIGINEVARYTSRSPAAIRQTMVRARAGEQDELGSALLELKVSIGKRRIMFNKKGLLEWLQTKAQQAVGA